MNKLNYDLEVDSDVFLEKSLELSSQLYKVEATTNADRSLPDSPQKPNEDYF